ncbi:MAG: tol-pal system YbgF family protein [Pirellulaceae bacterium]
MIEAIHGMAGCERKPPSWRKGLRVGLGVSVAAMVLNGVEAVGAAETVVVRSKARPGTVRMQGEVLEYTGTVLRLRHADGREEDVDAARVLSVDSDWPAPHQAADALFDAGKFSEASAAYQQAIQAEQRPWVRRRLVAQRIWCLRSVGQVEQSVELFLALCRDDVRTNYFDAIPIAWLSRPGEGVTERQAAAWMARSDSPVAVLIGASWLLASPQRAAALQALRGFVAHPDARIAFLADAQLWRAQQATVKADELERWLGRWERMPAELRAGPSYLLGQALARLDRPQEAALMWMRVPIQFPRERELAAYALWEAGRQLEKLQDREGARRLYREIVDRHGDAAVVAEARRALQASDESQRPQSSE